MSLNYQDRAAPPRAAATPPRSPGRIQSDRARGSQAYGHRFPLRIIVEILTVSLCVGLALLPILSAYTSLGPLYVVITGVITGALPVLIGGYLGWSAAVVMLAALAGYLVIGSYVVYSDQLAFGALPSGATVTQLLTSLVFSWKDSLTLEMPLGVADGILALPFITSYFGVGLATALVVWRRSWLSTLGVGALVYLVLGIAILWGGPSSALGTMIGVLLGLILTVWAAWRMDQWRLRRWPAIAGVLLVAVAGSVALTPVLLKDSDRFVLRDVVIPPFDPATQLSPLAKYRTFIKEDKDTVLVMATGLPKDALIRLATMDQFNGVVWDVSNSGGPNGSAAFRRVSATIELTPLEQAGQPYQIRMQLGDLTGVWVPTVGALRAISFDHETAPNVDFRFNDLTNTGIVMAGVTPGITYQMSGSLAHTPSDLALGDSEAGRVSQPAAENVPEVVRERALAVTRDSNTPALAARDLEQYLASGYFSHGEAAGGAPSLSGHGADRIAALLGGDLMVGDAEQYASAMALMANELGLPARVVLGFVAEEHDPDETLTFTGGDLTAWVEINFADFGWVPYFPTPDESRTPQESELPNEVEPEPQSNQLPPDPAPPIIPPKADTEEANVKTEQEDEVVVTDWARIAKIAAVIGVPIVLLAVGPIVILAAKWRRRRRRRRGADLAQITGGWDELLDTSYDLGLVPGPDLTRRQTARFLAGADPLARSDRGRTNSAGTRSHSPRGAELTKLAEWADHAVFSPEGAQEGDGPHFWTLTQRAIAAIRADRSWWARLRGKLSRASLRRARDERKAARMSGRSVKRKAERRPGRSAQSQPLSREL